MRVGFRLRLLLPLLLFVLLLAGCGVDAPETPTAVPTPTPTPREIGVRIAEATRASQSLHFTITLSGAPVYADPTQVFAITSIEGDLKRPDGMLATIQVTSPAALAEIRSVSLAGQQYFTNPITRQWSCLESGALFDPVVLFSPDQGVEHLLQEEFEEVELVGIEDLDGRAHYHLRGEIEGQWLMAISANTLGVGRVGADLWADTTTRQLTRMVLTDIGTDPANPSIWTMTFSEYGKTVDVRAPVDC